MTHCDADGHCAIFLQVIGASDDGKEFDAEDAQLQLDQGTPRQGLDTFTVVVPSLGSLHPRPVACTCLPPRTCSAHAPVIEKHDNGAFTA